MSRTTPRGLIEVTYYNAAQEYLRSLSPEHFMEAVPQATQRKITVASMELVHAQKPEVQTFNELLVQYPRRGESKPGQVVPDNMVVVHDEPINAETSFDVPLQPVGPFWVMEYVSKKSKRKDYEESYDKYEQELRVPYYLTFYPDTQDLTLYRHTGKRYRAVAPNGNDRCGLPELELEIALLDGWVRFWFRGELLPLPADLLRELTATREQLTRTRQQLEQTAQQRDEIQQQRDEFQQQRDEIQQQRDEFQQQRDEIQQQRDEFQQRLAEAERELTRLRTKPERPRKKPKDRS